MENKSATDCQVRLNTTSALQSKVGTEAMAEKTAWVSCVYFFFKNERAEMIPSALKCSPSVELAWSASLLRVSPRRVRHATCEKLLLFLPPRACQSDSNKRGKEWRSRQIAIEAQSFLTVLGRTFRAGEGKSVSLPRLSSRRAFISHLLLRSCGSEVCFCMVASFVFQRPADHHPWM